MSHTDKELAELVSRMTPRAREIFFEDIWPEVASESGESFIRELYRSDYKFKPVDVRTFLFDPQYLGGDIGKSTFPQLIDDLEALFEGYYTEVLLTGGIGWGKSRLAELGIAYELYRLSCLRAPARAYGLMPGSTLAFLAISVTRQQAINVLFKGFSDLVRNGPYFRRTFSCNPRIRSQLLFPNNIVAYPVSTTESSMLGEGVFSAVLDEMNFMDVVDHSRRSPNGHVFDQAQELYDRLSRRIRSRMNDKGQLPGHVWLVSSSRYPNDFTARKEAEARTNPHIFVRRYSAWDTRPRRSFLPGTFKVEIGDLTKRSRIVDGNESDINPDRIIEVPVDFRPEFERDPESCVRDYAGIATLTVAPFLGRRELIPRMFENGERAGLRHSFSNYDVTLQDESEHFLEENLQWTAETKNNRTIRRIHPGPYFMHVDLARVHDAAGIVIGHAIGEMAVERGVGSRAKTETGALIRVDLVLRIVAPPQGEILAANIRNVIYEFSKLGCHFGKITYDSFGSMESIQILCSQGYPAEEFSVDRTTSAYENLKMAIYDGRLLCYRVPVCERARLRWPGLSRTSLRRARNSRKWLPWFGRSWRPGR